MRNLCAQYNSRANYFYLGTTVHCVWSNILPVYRNWFFSLPLSFLKVMGHMDVVGFIKNFYIYYPIGIFIVFMMTLFNLGQWITWYMCIRAKCVWSCEGYDNGCSLPWSNQSLHNPLIITPCLSLHHLIPKLSPGTGIVRIYVWAVDSILRM